MAIDLTQRFRFKDWKDIIGQKPILDLIQPLIAENRFPVFSLLSGPPGVGKSALAYLIGMAITCTGEGTRPCHTCDNCKLAHQENSPAIIRVNMSLQEGHKDVLAIIREIFENKSMNPHTVYILEEIQDLFSRNDATNADQQLAPFLDALEHIPDDITIICCTTAPNRLNRAFRERAAQFQLTSPSEFECVEFVQRIGIALNIRMPSENILRYFVNQCDCNPRKILKTMEVLMQSSELSEESIRKYLGLIPVTDQIHLMRLLLLPSKDPTEYLHTVFEYKRSGMRIQQILRTFRNFCMEALFECTLNAATMAISKDERKELKALVAESGKDALLRLMNLLRELPNSDTDCNYFFSLLQYQMQGETEASVLQNKAPIEAGLQADYASNNERVTTNETIQRSNESASQGKQITTLSDADMAMGTTELFGE